MSRKVLSRVVCWTAVVFCAALAAHLAADPPDGEGEPAAEALVPLFVPADEPAQLSGRSTLRLRLNDPRYQALRERLAAEPPLIIGERRVWPRGVDTPPVNCLAQAGRADGPCRRAAEIARMPPCLKRDGCLAYDSWREAFGEPYILKVEPERDARPALPKPLPAAGEE